MSDSIGDPACLYCEEELGGIIEARPHPDGGEYAVCVLNGQEYNAWALYRGEMTPELPAEDPKPSKWMTYLTFGALGLLGGTTGYMLAKGRKTKVPAALASGAAFMVAYGAFRPGGWFGKEPA